MFNAPIIRLEVESMKHAMVTAFNNQSLNFSKELQLALDRAISPDVIQATIDKAAREVVAQTVDSAVRKWWATSEVAQDLIKQAVTKRLEEEAGIWKDR